MLVSRRSRYGVQAALDLAEHGGAAPVSIREIASRQGLPEAYLEQLMGPLRKMGIVQSARGPQGGYTLSASPEDVSVADIVRALDGEAWAAECPCGGTDANCLDHTLWRRVASAFTASLERETLASLLAERRDLAERPLYQI